MIDKLDVLISRGKGDTKYSLLMYETLLKKFNSPNINKSLHQNGVRFVNSVKLLLEHLLNFRYYFTQVLPNFRYYFNQFSMTSATI